MGRGHVGLHSELEKAGKPFIVFGDMVVARLEIDTYDSDYYHYENEGYRSAEQSDLNTLLETGNLNALRQSTNARKGYKHGEAAALPKGNKGMVEAISSKCHLWQSSGNVVNSEQMFLV